MPEEPVEQLEEVLSGTTFPTPTDLRELLQRYNESPADRESVLEEINRRFSKRLAVLVLDTCGFSRAVRGRGIVHFMALLERLERVVRPGIESHQGRVLRREADNVYAVFDDPASAVEAARRIIADVRAANEALPQDEEVEISIGIGYGDLLTVGHNDVWGDEMNLASKLGEDVAECGEILLTPAAHDAVEHARDDLEERTVTVSGLELTAYRVAGSGD